MELIRLRATQSFVDQEGDISEGDEILVNDERARALISTGRAEHVPPGTPAAAQEQNYQSFALDSDAEPDQRSDDA